MTTTLLHESLQHGTLALFLSGDLTRQVAGVPSRADLARALAQRHNLDVTASLARVAQQVGRGGYRREFTVFLREQLQGAQPQPFHRRVVDFVRENGIKTLITTAYDDLLKRAFETAGVPVEVVWKDSQLAVAFQDRPHIIQLYGNPLSDVESLVVTEDDHLDLWRDRSRESVLDEVKHALQRNTVLFLGYNLSDPDFLLLWREILSRAGDLHRRAFAVWPRLPEAEAGVWADRGIVILEEDPWGLSGETGKKRRLQVRVDEDGQMTVPLPDATGKVTEVSVFPVTTFSELAMEKAAAESPQPPEEKFELFFNGSLMHLHSLMRSLQEKLHQEYRAQHPNKIFDPEIAYCWQGIEGDTFRITLIDLRSDEPCGNVSAFSIPRGSRLEVRYLNNPYARAVWERLHTEMARWGFLDEVTISTAQYGIEASAPPVTNISTLSQLVDILNIYPENEGKPHQPRKGGQWFSRLVIESSKSISNCEAEIHEIKRLSSPNDCVGDSVSEFAFSSLSWAKNHGFFGQIDLQAGRKVYLDLAWRDRGDSKIAAEDLRVASALDPGDRNDEAKDHRQDFIILKPGEYLFTVRIFAKDYDNWIERTYRLHWPGAEQEPNIRLTEVQKSHKLQDLEVSMPEAPSISPELYQQVQAALLRCGSFRSDSDLPPLFVDSRISPWRDDLPSANSSSKRVQAVVDYLLPKFNTAGENALVLLLRVLRDHVSRGDACYGQLGVLAEELAGVVESPVPVVTLPQPTPPLPSAALSGSQKRRLIQALLACPTVSNRGTRDIVVNDLPGDIKANIRRNDVDRFDVSSIVTACSNYVNGLHELIETIRFYEGDSIPMQAIDKLWRTLQ